MGEDHVVTSRREGFVGGISIGLQHPGKALEQGGRMFGSAARRIGVGHGRRVAASPAPLVLGNGPEVPLFVLPRPGSSTGAFVSSMNSRGAVRSFARMCSQSGFSSPAA